MSLNKKWTFCIFSILTLVIVVNFITLPQCTSLRKSIETYGMVSQFFYILGCTVAIVLFIPRTPLIFLAGICFGAVTGGLLNLIASLIAAYICFYIGKSLKKESFDHWLRKQSWFEKIDKLALEKSLFFVLAIRMVHFVHFGISSYALGLSPIKTNDFLMGTLLGILPGTFALSYVGENVGCATLSGFSHLPVELQIKLGLSLTLLTIVGILP